MNDRIDYPELLGDTFEKLHERYRRAVISLYADNWDAGLMRYFAAREGEPPWYWIAPERQRRCAYWGLAPDEIPH